MKTFDISVLIDMRLNMNYSYQQIIQLFQLFKPFIRYSFSNKIIWQKNWDHQNDVQLLRDL